MAMAAASGWDKGPGAGPTAGVGLSAGDSAISDAVFATTLAALDNLAGAVPALAAKLPSRQQLEARQRTLAQNGGSLEQIGGSGGEPLQFRVSERIGEGTFCVVFRGELLLSPGSSSGKPGGEPAQKKPVAAKFELRRNDSTQLRNEFRMYKRFNNCPGIAKIYSFGEMDFHKVLIMDLLGPSLEKLLHECGRRFSTKTVAMLAKQMIARIQTIHENGLIYRDVKPENFLVGLLESDAAGMVHLIDFGMAKVFRDPDTNEHIPFGEAQSLSGTARYMSINAHCRRSQSRRDDLEALGHVFVYFLRGSLPWQGVKVPPSDVNNDARHDLMCAKKQATPIGDLCRGLPPQLAEYLVYTRGLDFDAEPNYAYLAGLFDQVLADQGAVDDGVYDWMVKPPPAAASAKPVQAAESASTPSAGDAHAGQRLSNRPLTPATATAERVAESSSEAAAAGAGAIHRAGTSEEPLTTAAPPRPATPPQIVSNSSTSGTGHHAPIVVPPPVPASPPGGKRRRSEFASDLQPPPTTRVLRAKKTASYYDSEAQRTLVTLYREVMAKRYAFHRAVGQRGGGGGSGVGGGGRPETRGGGGGGREGGNAAAMSAAAAAAAALQARSSSMSPGVYTRPLAPLSRLGTPGGGAGGRSSPASASSSVLAPAFTELLDKTLSKVIAELETLSDRLLQDGDWSGAGRVQGWLAEVADAVAQEAGRLRALRAAKQQRGEEVEEEEPERPGGQPVSEGPLGIERGRRRGNVVAVVDVADPMTLSAAAAADEKKLPRVARDIRGREGGKDYALPSFDPGLPLEVDDEEEEEEEEEDGDRPELGASPAVEAPRHRLPPPLPRYLSMPSGSSSSGYGIRREPDGGGDGGGASPSAAVRSGMGHLSLEADTSSSRGPSPLAAGDAAALEVDDTDGGTIDADDADEGDPNSDVFALVYRTASGTRKVVKVASKDVKR